MTVLVYVVNGEEFLSLEKATKEAARSGSKIVKSYRPTELSLQDFMKKRQRA